MIELTIDGRTVTVTEGTTVAAAVMMNAGPAAFRGGHGALCGMGICFECRVTLDGRMHERSCQTLCRAGMEVTTAHARR